MDAFIDRVLAAPLTTRTLSHTTHRQKTGVYLHDGNEVVEGGLSPPLDLDPKEVIEADEETLPYAEEDWKDPEQMEVPKILEPDLPFTIQT